MSVQTSLLCYCNDSSLSLDKIAAEIGKVLGITEVEFLEVEDRHWENGEEHSDTVISKEDFRLVNSDLTEYFKRGTNLAVHADFANIMTDLKNVQKTAISADVRGSFLLDRFTLQLGRTPFATSDENDAEQLRFRIGFWFWGYSTPPDCAEFERTLIASKAWHAFKLKLEHLVGTLEHRLWFG